MRAPREPKIVQESPREPREAATATPAATTTTSSTAPPAATTAPAATGHSAHTSHIIDFWTAQRDPKTASTEVLLEMVDTGGQEQAGADDTGNPLVILLPHSYSLVIL
jgi:hypothetical protein